MKRGTTGILLAWVLMIAAILLTGCSVDLFSLEYDVIPRPMKVAAVPASATTVPQATQPRSIVETVKAFLTLYPCLQDILAVIKANGAIPVPSEYHKRFVLLRIKL